MPSRTPPGFGGAGSVSSSRRPPRVITIRSEPSKALPPRRVEQLRDLGLQLAAEHVRQAQVRPRTLQAVEVVGEREGGPVVDPDHLEHAVAAQQTLVGDGDREVVRGRDLAVKGAQLGRLQGGVVCHAGILPDAGRRSPRLTCMLVDMRIQLSDRAGGGSARDQVYAALRDAIVCAELEPGRRLSENELAELLGVSRTPIREALVRLRDDRLVAIVPQLGTFVTLISNDAVADAAFVREALECGAIRLATERATDARPRGAAGQPRRAGARRARGRRLRRLLRARRRAPPRALRAQRPRRSPGRSASARTATSTASAG